VSRDFFKLFGTTTIIGRTFSPEEDSPNGQHAVVLSNGWWTRRFASDPGVIGKTIQLSGEPYVVIGVLAKGFDPTEIGMEADVWTPFQIDANTRDQAHYFRSAARIKPGVTLGQAQAKLAQSADEFRQLFPNALGKNAGFSVEPMQNVFIRNS